MKATFENTVSILVKAYFEGTLEHGNCCACAVGNIIADRMGVVPKKMNRIDNEGGKICWPNRVIPAWPDVFVTNSPTSKQKLRTDMYYGDSKHQIDLTGYSLIELARIEETFERNRILWATDKEDEQAMFNGLMAVVDVLAEIHGINLQQKESAKLMFVKV